MKMRRRWEVLLRGMMMMTKMEKLGRMKRLRMLWRGDAVVRLLVSIKLGTSGEGGGRRRAAVCALARVVLY